MPVGESAADLKNLRRRDEGLAPQDAAKLVDHRARKALQRAYRAFPDLASLAVGLPKEGMLVHFSPVLLPDDGHMHARGAVASAYYTCPNSLATHSSILSQIRAIVKSFG
jgi:hypothetical protein